MTMPDEQPVDQLTRRRIRLARYYLRLADAHFESAEENSQFAAINLLHEALEASLITASDRLGADISQKSTIENYLTKIEQSSKSKLPLKTEVLRFNRARVSAKHALTLPSERDTRDFIATIPVFCRELLEQTCGIAIDQVSLVGLIENEEIKRHLEIAEGFIERGENSDALLEIRKAFYLKFLHRFDIRPFEGKDDLEKYGFLDDRSMCSAPIYAKSNSYIQNKVSNPLDYIVLDYSLLDNECLKNGVRPSEFWNVWRLTPDIVKMPDGSWLSKREPQDDHDTAQQHAHYAFDTLIDILLTFQASSGRTKSRGNTGLWLVKVDTGTRIYSKCSRESDVAQIIPDEPMLLSTSDAYPALDENAYFWSVMHFKKGGPFFSGYLHENDFDGELIPYDPELIGLRPKV